MGLKKKSCRKRDETILQIYWAPVLPMVKAHENELVTAVPSCHGDIITPNR